MDVTERQQGPIGWRFVFTLLGFGMLLGTLMHVMSPYPIEKTVLDHHLESMSEGRRGLAVLGILAAFLLALWGASALLQAFWNRFLSDVFRLRAITLPEALAIGLMWSLLFAGWS